MGFRTDALSVSLRITRNASRKNERSSVCLEIKRKGGEGRGGWSEDVRRAREEPVER